MLAAILDVPIRSKNGSNLPVVGALCSENHSRKIGGVFVVLEKIKNKRSAPQARKKRREEEGEERGEEEEGRRDFTEPLAACARLGMLRINRNVHFCGL